MPYESAVEERSEAVECEAIERDAGGEERGTVRDRHDREGKRERPDRWLIASMLRLLNFALQCDVYSGHVCVFSNAASCKEKTPLLLHGLMVQQYHCCRVSLYVLLIIAQL